MKAAVDVSRRASLNLPSSVQVDPTKCPDSTTGNRATLLHIGSDLTRVTCIRGDQPEEVLVLEIGYGKTATDFFKHVPPTTLELENAIMTVEDEVISAGKWLVLGSALWTRDLGIREMAQLAGVPATARMVLSVDAVEQQFDLLAAWVQGRPGSSAGIPMESSFAARLLILREFMHHLQFTSITIEVDQTPC